MCKGAVLAEDNRVMKSWRRPFTEGVLTEEELQQYWDEGFVVKKDLLSKEQLDAVKNAINRCPCSSSCLACASIPLFGADCSICYSCSRVPCMLQI